MRFNPAQATCQKVRATDYSLQACLDVIFYYFKSLSRCLAKKKRACQDFYQVIPISASTTEATMCLLNIPMSQKLRRVNLFSC